MAMRHKSSVTPAAEPNLIPGQIGINVPDDAMFYRADGKVNKIALGRWRTGAAPAEGAQDGAPLMIGPEGPIWTGEYAPSSRVNGHVRVDTPPPVDGFSLPGSRFVGPAPDLVIAPGEVITEPFYVASDQINVSGVAFNVINKPAGQMRLAVVDADMNVLVLAGTTSQVTGARFLGMVTTLLRGHYQLVAWVANGAALGSVRSLVPNQGWTADANNVISFLHRRRALASFQSTINFTNVTLVEERSPEPGQPKSLMLRWTYPTD